MSSGFTRKKARVVEVSITRNDGSRSVLQGNHAQHWKDLIDMRLEGLEGTDFEMPSFDWRKVPANQITVKAAGDIKAGDAVYSVPVEFTSIRHERMRRSEEKRQELRKAKFRKQG